MYTASITPAGVRCAGEVADGVLPIWMDPENFAVLGTELDKGFAKAGEGKSLQDFDVAPVVRVAMNDDLDAAYATLRPWLALYIGGMGAKGRNFYNDYTRRLGYEEMAERVQDLFLAGKQAEAEAAVTDEFIDAISLVGSSERIRERLSRWKEAGNRQEVGSLILKTDDTAAFEVCAKELL